MCEPAKLVQRGTRRQWACPCCDRTLGEVYDDRVVVKAGDRLIVFTVHANVEQTCPKCGTVSAVMTPECAA